jgi:hypothetical protein
VAEGEKGGQLHIPASTRDDVRRESYLWCAICGHMDNRAVAHIEAVAATLISNTHLTERVETSYKTGQYREIGMSNNYGRNHKKDLTADERRDEGIRF